MYWPYFGRNRSVPIEVEISYLRPKSEILFYDYYYADDSLIHPQTQSDTPSSFALGYQYAARTGLNIHIFALQRYW